MHKSKLVYLIACGAVVLAQFLPAAHVGMLSMAMIQGPDGMVFIVMAVISALLALHEVREPFRVLTRVLAGVMGSVLALFSAAKIESLLSMTGSGPFQMSATPGIGLYLTLGGALTIIVVPWLRFSETGAPASGR